jgi:UDP-2-acetamido-2,6-beta-L-arabino-hexul-4-ose reductase
VTKVLVTGADGFIGRNLCVRLGERADCEVLRLVRASTPGELAAAAQQADFVFHLAGVNRPQDPAEFQTGNAGLTEGPVTAMASAQNKAPIVYSSSIQAERDNPYGASKLAAEAGLRAHAEATGAPVRVFRLANVFGKWCRPNYNSAVATFCHNVAHGLPIEVHDPAAELRLVYIDDVIDAFLSVLDHQPEGFAYENAEPVYRTTVGEVADAVRGFPESRETLVIPEVGTGLMRALHATYLSYLPPAEFAYSVPVYSDSRGIFAEMLKTRASGQFSYFTAGPGVTRGEHYHHSKTEKFLVLSGTAHFGFRNILTDEEHEITVKGGEGRIVETIPGWTHNITNVGEGEMLVMLWANEIFDREHPDTFSYKV